MSYCNVMEDRLNDYWGNNTAPAAIAAPHMALHTADPGETGANEVAGGSYARQPASFGASSGGDIASDTLETFTSMPATTVVAISVFDALSVGNCLVWGWLRSGTDTWVPFISDNPAGDTLTSPNHGMSNNDRVVVTVELMGALPAGLVAGTIYHVVGTTTDTFQLSLTQGGAAVDITADGMGAFQRIQVKTINSGDKFEVASGDFKFSTR